MRATAAVALLLAGSGTPGPVSAEEPSEGVQLPGSTAAVLTVDLDADGAREVVRLTATEEPEQEPTNVFVEVWRHAEDRWTAAGSRVVERTVPDRGRVPARFATDAIGLLAWNDGPRERVLVAVGPQPSSQDPTVIAACCVELFDLVVTTGGLELVALQGFEESADSIGVADLDADGTDEFVVSSAPGRGGLPQVTIMRWSDGAFAPLEPVEVGTGPYGTFPTLALGSSDGVPGDDIVYGPFEDGSVARLSFAADGSLNVEDAAWAEPTEFHWFVGNAGGDLYAQGQDGLSIWRWPRGKAPEFVARLGGRPSEFVSVLTAGEHEAIVTVDLGPESSRAMTVTSSRDPDREIRLVASSAAAELMEIVMGRTVPLATDSNLFPYSGHFPSLPDGRVAFVAAGQLVTLDTAGDVATRQIGAMASGYPAGLAGEGGAWLVLSTGFGNDPRFTYLFSGTYLQGTASIVPLAAVLEREGDVGEVISAAAAPTGMWDGRELPVVGEEGLVVTVSAPAGSVVIGTVNSVPVFEGVAEGAVWFAMAPNRSSDRDRDYSGTVVVVAPTGQTYVRELDFVVLRSQPWLEASAATHVGEMSASVTGRASALATVLVDGRPVEPDSDGSFEVRVDANPWPRDIRVVARDPLGQEAVTVLTVVGLFDYRTLPWVPIAAGVIVLAGAIFFLRAPRRVRPATQAPSTLSGSVELDGMGSIEDDRRERSLRL